MATQITAGAESVPLARRRAGGVPARLLCALRLLLAAWHAFVRAGQLGPVSSVETGRRTGARR